MDKPGAEEKPLAVASAPIYQQDAETRAQTVME